ncbi:MAG: alpha/beta hydrolase [Steroidobacteraceae bacterium]
MTINRRQILARYGALGGLTLATAGAASADGVQPAGQTATVRTADGAQLRIRDIGQGHTIVLIHSWALSQVLWDPVVALLLARGYRCVTYDMRGHGHSTEGFSSWTADILVDDLARVWKHRELADATIVAHSMGCGTACRFAGRTSGRHALRLVLVSPTTPYNIRTADHESRVSHAALEALHALWIADFPQWVTENAPAFFSPDTSAARVQWGINLCLQTPLTVALAANRIDMETDYRNDLRRLSAPTLIVHGDADVSASLVHNAQATAALVAQSKLKIYAGAPHGLPLTHALELANDIADWC